MIINTKKIEELNPCQSRFDNYLKHYVNFEGNLRDFIMLENITYSDKVWVVTRLFTPEQNIKWSLLCASKVLYIFEEKNPNDNRPRKALEAVEKWLNETNEENRLIANAAASAAYAAADAAYAAANYTAYAAAKAAVDAAYAAANYTAYAAANAAANAAASAANDENRKSEEELNLLLMLECI